MKSVFLIYFTLIELPLPLLYSNKRDVFFLCLDRKQTLHQKIIFNIIIISSTNSSSTVAVINVCYLLCASMQWLQN